MDSLRQFVSYLRWGVDQLIWLTVIAGGIALVLVTTLITIDVVGGYFFGRPVTGTLDISQMAMALMVFGGMAYADRHGGHIAVDILQDRYPAVVNHLLDIIVALGGAALFALVAWRMYRHSIDVSQRFNTATNILQIPHMYVEWVVVGIAVIAAISMLLRGIEIAISPNKYKTAPVAAQSVE